MTEPFVSRGFRGRRQPAVTAGRLPPGQYETRDFPVLSGGPHAADRSRSVGLHTAWHGYTGGALDVGGIPGVAARDSEDRHPLRHEMVQVRHGLGGASRWTRSWRRPSHAASGPRPTC